MKHLFTIIVSICLYSCASQTNPEYSILRDKVELLERRVDSLESVLNTRKSVLNDKRIVTQKKKKRSEKNAGESVFNKSSSVEKNYSENSYETSYPASRQSIKKNPSYSGRCQAITKKGYQCSRNARSGGYCWQHGG